MPRIFKGSESELRLLLSKSLKDLTDVSIILYTTDLQEAIEVIDGIAIEDNIATLILAPRAFMGMEDGVLNYIVKAKNDGQEYHMERQSNYVLKSISHINEDGVATQTIEITKNGEYMITPNDGLYVNLNVAIEDENGSFDDGYTEGYSIGQAEGYGTGYAVGYETGQNEGVAEYVETLPIKEITENGEYREITKGVNVNVPNQTTKLEVTENGTYTPPIPFIGYDEVDVQVDIPEIQSDKTITLYAGETGTITPDQGYDAMDKVNYTCVAGASKTVLPNGLILSGSTFTEFDGSKYDVSERTDFSNFFENCNYVETMDLSSWDMGQARSIFKMFSQAKKLTDPNIGNWDVSNVINMKELFFQCYNFLSLDLSSWDTGNVEDMEGLFYECYRMTSLNVSTWNTSKVHNMKHLFRNCGFSSLDISNWDVSNVENMEALFYYCDQLTSLDISKWVFTNVNKMNSMFSNCSGLTSMELNNLSNTQTLSLYAMFWDCENLKEVKISGHLNEVSMSLMFYNCHNLTTVDFSDLIVENITDVASMFNGVHTSGTFYYNAQCDYSKIIAVLPATWTAVPKN